MAGAGILAVAVGAIASGVMMDGSPVQHARYAVQGAILAYLIAHALILVTMHLAAARGLGSGCSASPPAACWHSGMAIQGSPR